MPFNNKNGQPILGHDKDKTDDRMKKEFLLHKDKIEKKENATAQMAHLVLPDTQADTSQNQKSHFFQRLRLSEISTY